MHLTHHKPPGQQNPYPQQTQEETSTQDMIKHREITRDTEVRESTLLYQNEIIYTPQIKAHFLLPGLAIIENKIHIFPYLRAKIAMRKSAQGLLCGRTI